MNEAPDGLALYELAGADPALRFSPHCWKVRMALAHKGLAAQGIPWRFADKAALAFAGPFDHGETVPILLDGGEAVVDSWRIARHLDRRFPDRPSPFGAAGAVPLARFINHWADNALVPALARLLLLDIHDCLDAGDRDYFRRSRERRFGGTLEQVVADRPAHLATLRALLSPLRQTLGEQPFLGGAEPHYADYCLFGPFMWARCVSPVRLVEEDDPVFAWRERLLDAFDGHARAAPTFETCRGT